MKQAPTQSPATSGAPACGAKSPGPSFLDAHFSSRRINASHALDGPRVSRRCPRALAAGQLLPLLCLLLLSLLPRSGCVYIPYTYDKLRYPPPFNSLHSEATNLVSTCGLLGELGRAVCCLRVQLYLCFVPFLYLLIILCKYPVVIIYELLYVYADALSNNSHAPAYSLGAFYPPTQA